MNEKKDNRCQPWDDTDAGIIWKEFCSSHCKNASVSIYELHRIKEKTKNLSKKIKILSKEIHDIKKNQMDILGKKNKNRKLSGRGEAQQQNGLEK